MERFALLMKTFLFFFLFCNIALSDKVITTNSFTAALTTEGELVLFGNCYQVYYRNLPQKALKPIFPKTYQIKLPKKRKVIDFGFTGNTLFFLDENNVVWKTEERVKIILGIKVSSYFVKQKENIKEVLSGKDSISLFHNNGERFCQGYYTRSSRIQRNIISGFERGYNHELFLLKDDRVYALGDNLFGQCGHENKLSAHWVLPLDVGIKQIIAQSDFSLLFDEHGQVWFFGSMSIKKNKQDIKTAVHVPTIISNNLPPIVKIAAGYAHALLLDSEGSVWGFGINTNGQLGVSIQLGKRTMEPKLIYPSTQSFIVDIAAANAHSVLIDADGKMFTFGNNNYGQLGHGETNILEPTQVLNIPQIKTVTRPNNTKNANSAL